MLLITHEPDIAGYAARVVTVRDGRVVERRAGRRAGATPRPELLALPPVEAEV